MNAENDEESTPLHIAVKRLHVGNVDVLLQSKWGAAIDSRDGDGNTSLHLVCSETSWSRSYTIFKALMIREAAVDSTNSDGATPLHLACNSKYFSDFTLPLLARGAPVSAADNAGCTPLFYASQKGCLEAVQELLMWGAKADAASNDGRTPLAVAEAGGHLKVANYLCEHMRAAP